MSTTRSGLQTPKEASAVNSTSSLLRPIAAGLAGAAGLSLLLFAGGVGTASAKPMTDSAARAHVRQVVAPKAVKALTSPQRPPYPGFVASVSSSRVRCAAIGRRSSGTTCTLTLKTRFVETARPQMQTTSTCTLTAKVFYRSRSASNRRIRSRLGERRCTPAPRLSTAQPAPAAPPVVPLAPGMQPTEPGLQPPGLPPIGGPVVGAPGPPPPPPASTPTNEGTHTSHIVIYSWHYEGPAYYGWKQDTNGVYWYAAIWSKVDNNAYSTPYGPAVHGYYVEFYYWDGYQTQYWFSDES
jgi:hypothetical protein